MDVFIERKMLVDYFFKKLYDFIVIVNTYLLYWNTYFLKSWISDMPATQLQMKMTTINTEN